MILVYGGLQPSRLTPEIEKNEDYHLRFGRFTADSCNTSELRSRLDRYELNSSFYMGNQWMMAEDRDAFFMDEEGRDLGRIKTIRNYIQPMVEQYRGTAARMAFRYKVQGTSPSVISRREEMLNRLLIYNDIGEYNPELMDRFREEFPMIGRTAQDTVAMFDNLYVDEYMKDMNRLLDRAFKYNNIQGTLMQKAIDVALAGICIEHPHPYNGEYLFERVAPDRFAFDNTAKLPDLSDSQYFTIWEDMMPTSIYERYPSVSAEHRKAIEKFVTTGPARMYQGSVPSLNRPLVYTTYWRDTCPQEYAYVVDEFQLTSLCRINFVENGEAPKYTYSDVLPMSKLSDGQKDILKKRRHIDGVMTIYTDIWRFCTFIPTEELPNPDKKDKSLPDLVLDYGVMPYQEPDAFVPTNMKPPIKCGTWSYVNGEVLSPVDVAINPQRMINRFESIMEQHINSAGGSGPILDGDALGTVPEAEAIGTMKRGDPLIVHGKRMGVNNIVGRYDAGITSSATVFANLMDSYKVLMEETTGVNAQLKGAVNPDQLVGAMQMAMQQGSVIQEPFYQAIHMCIQGLAQATVTSGKRMYIDQDRVFMDFSNIVGSDGVEVLSLSADLRNEDFRAFVERTADAASERQEVDQLILVYKQYGMLDPIRANMFTGRATKSELLGGLADYAKEMIILQKQQQEAAANEAQAQQQQMADMAVSAKEEQTRKEGMEQENKDLDRAVKVLPVLQGQK